MLILRQTKQKAIEDGTFTPSVSVGDEFVSDGKRYRVTSRKSALFDGSDDFVCTRIDKDGNPVKSRIVANKQWLNITEEKSMKLSDILNIKSFGNTQSQDNKQTNVQAITRMC